MTIVVAFLVRLRDGAASPGIETVIVKAIVLLLATVVAAEATAGAAVAAGAVANDVDAAPTSDLKVEKS